MNPIIDEAEKLNDADEIERLRERVKELESDLSEVMSDPHFLTGRTVNP